MKVQLNVSGFEYEASFSNRELDEIIKPLIVKFSRLRTSYGRRIVVFLAAPPATGKSTFSLYLEKISREMDEVVPVQSVSLDGFHYPNDYLVSNKAIVGNKEVCLSEVKGMPETFDLKKFKSYLEKLRHGDVKWPIYDRNLHDVLNDQITIQSEIILIEGNWLLLDEEGWRELKDLCDYSIFIHSSESLLKDRLIGRKIRGGLTPYEAEKFYENSDRKNIQRAMEHRLEADLTLEMIDSGELIIKKDS